MRRTPQPLQQSQDTLGAQQASGAHSHITHALQTAHQGTQRRWSPSPGSRGRRHCRTRMSHTAGWRGRSRTPAWTRTQSNWILPTCGDTGAGRGRRGRGEAHALGQRTASAANGRRAGVTQTVNRSRGPTHQKLSLAPALNDSQSTAAWAAAVATRARRMRPRREDGMPLRG